MEVLVDDLVRVIGSFLDYASYGNLRLTSRRFRSVLVFSHCSPHFWQGALCHLVSYHGDVILHKTDVLFQVPLDQFMGASRACDFFCAHFFQPSFCQRCGKLKSAHCTPRVNIDWRGQKKNVVAQKTKKMPFLCARSLFCNLKWTIVVAEYVVSVVMKERYEELKKTGGFDRLESYVYGPLEMDEETVEEFVVEIGIYGDNFGVSDYVNIQPCKIAALKEKIKKRQN